MKTRRKLSIPSTVKTWGGATWWLMKPSLRPSEVVAAAVAVGTAGAAVVDAGVVVAGAAVTAAVVVADAAEIAEAAIAAIAATAGNRLGNLP